MSPKETFRGIIKKRLSAVPGKEFYTQGAGAAELLCNSPIWSRYKTIFLFLSTDLEIDTRPLLESALKETKTVFAPKVEAAAKSAGKLVFHRLLSCDGPWGKGPYGIREPIGGRPPEEGDFPALILTPGLAFDREGNRLGHGKGYYDRFFAELDAEQRQYAALGLCLDIQLELHIPNEEIDKKTDAVLTGKELLILKEDTFTRIL